MNKPLVGTLAFLAIALSIVFVGTNLETGHSLSAASLYANVKSVNLLPTKPQAESAILTTDKDIATTESSEVELDMPDYVPEALRHPQKFFSGRTLEIKGVFDPKESTTITIKNNNTSEIRDITKEESILPEKDAEEGLVQADAVKVNIPYDLPTGEYTINITNGKNQKEVHLPIQGPDKEIPEPAEPPPVPQAHGAEPNTVTYYLKNIYSKSFSASNWACGSWWEMAIAGQPNNANNLVIAGPNDKFCYSTDAGNTWTPASISALSPAPFSNYVGDEKLRFDNSGKLYWAALFLQPYGDNRELINGALYKENILGGPFTATALVIPPIDLPADTSLIDDYPKLAIKPGGFLDYISENAVRKPDGYIEGLSFSQNSGSTFTRPVEWLGTAATSLDVAPNGKVYGGIPNLNIELYRFNPVPSGSPQLITVSRRQIADLHQNNFDYYAVPRLTSQSDRTFFAYRGPEVVIDKSSGSHQGRIYVVWSDPRSVIHDPNNEYSYYGYNYDVFVSYSDNEGQTWSPPVRVNDDNTSADQFFPSASVDEVGTLHVVFLDRREDPTQVTRKLNLYYTQSNDGIHFTPNQRVNDNRIRIGPEGGRTIGDYLDMVVGHQGAVQTAYPCTQNNSSWGPDSICFTSFKLIRISG